MPGLLQNIYFTYKPSILNDLNQLFSAAVQFKKDQ